MADIDYTEKIATFNLLVGNNNEEIAFNYLSLTNWDETKAAMLYNQENKGKDAKVQTSINVPNYQNTPNYQNIPNYLNSPTYQNFPNYQNIPNINIIGQNYNNKPSIHPYNNNNIPKTYREPRIIYKNINNNLSKLNKYDECEIYQKGFFDGLNIFKIDNRGYFQNFGNISNKCIKLYDSFIQNLSTNVGLILIYNKKTYNEALDVLKNINNNELTKELLSTRTIIIPLIQGCLEANKIIKQMKIKKFPSILICFYKNETHFAVIGIISDVMQNIQKLNEKLLESHELFNDGNNIPSLTNNQPKNDLMNNMINYNKNNNFNNNNMINNNINNNINNINKNNVPNNNVNNNINNKESILNDINNYLPEDINQINKINRDSITYMTDAEVLAKQEREMKSLERMEENKRLEEERKEREKKEEEEKKKEEELIQKIQKESILNILPEEPSDDNPDKCVIVFRFPDGEKVIQRKFLKSDTVSLLYLYVKSLGRDIYSENEEQHFSLIQSFPFKNFDEVQNNSLEQEGLFPNAVLQIKAIE